MDFNFVNKCSVSVLVSVNDKEKFTLGPHENKMITLDDFYKINLIVRKKDESFLEKTVFSKKYKLTVETAYELLITDNEPVTFIFLRECVRVSGDAYYEKIILKNKPACCVEKNNVICGLNIIKKVYNKRRLAYLLLVSPFEHMTLLCIAVAVLAIVFAVKISIIFSCLFFLIAYTVITGIDFLAGKFCDRFYKKVLNADSEKEEFEKILDNNFLNTFYSDERLKAFNDEIFIDEQ